MSEDMIVFLMSKLGALQCEGAKARTILNTSRVHGFRRSLVRARRPREVPHGGGVQQQLGECGERHRRDADVCSRLPPQRVHRAAHQHQP